MKKDNKKNSCLILVIFFALFIGGFTVLDFIKSDENFSEFENRYLTQSPTMTWDSLMDNSYTATYEKFINDQFILRNNWIDFKSKAEMLLLKIENNGIVYGKENMLFEKYNAVNAEQLQKNIGFIKEFANGKDNITFSVIPSAYEIYRENLPYGITMVDQQAKTKEIYESLAGTVKTIDLYPSLIENKENYIYYRTDHHWTTKGAYIAYQKYCEEKGLIPVLVNFDDAVKVQDFYGTYFNKSKNTSLTPDTLMYFDFPITATVNGEVKDNYLDLNSFEKRDKYAAFLYGNNGITVLKSKEKAGQNGKILVIKDSFSNCFAPFLTYNYDEVYIVDLRSLPMGLNELLANNEFKDILIMYNFKNFESDTNLYRFKY